MRNPTALIAASDQGRIVVRLAVRPQKSIVGAGDCGYNLCVPGSRPSRYQSRPQFARQLRTGGATRPGAHQLASSIRSSTSSFSAPTLPWLVVSWPTRATIQKSHRFRHSCLCHPRHQSKRRSAGISVPVIYMTGNEDPAVRKAALDSGCIALLTKPFSVQALMEPLKNVSAERT